jgi:SAM-dependent methyltransferase
LYQSRHSFVFEFGKDVLAILDPQPGERILDVGCGTGQLTAEIARAGAEVTGIDSSPEMIARARSNFPEIRFEIHDICDLPFRGEFDAVFSNAVLHWVTRADEAASALSRALKPGGRFAGEFGGKGNVRAFLEASDRALREVGVEDPERFHPWFYPGIAEYSGILERHGLEVTFAHLFDRPTPLEDGDEGFSTWLRMFGSRLTEAVDPARIPEYHRLVREFAAPALRRGEGWVMDYRRLRVQARKTS